MKKSLSHPSNNSVLRTFTALRQHNFRLFWFGLMISLIGSWMQSIGQVWLVLELSHGSAFQLGVVGALQLLPVLLFSLFGGVFADRWPKRRVLLLTQSAAMTQALLLWALVATQSVQLWHVYILALLLGLTTCLDMPTRQAFVVEMVGREDLPNAVALNSSLASLARVIGPGLGGVIIAASGVQWLFLLNAISFLAVLVALLLINTHELHAQTIPAASEGKRQTTWQSLREGLDYVWKTPAVLLAILVVGLVLFFGSNFNVVLPLFATTVLHAGSTGFGLLSAALGAGALIAALWLAWGNRQPTMRRVLTGTLIFGLLEVIFAVQHLYPLAVFLIACIGFMETSFAQLSVTTLQIVAPDHLRGRVISIYIFFFDGSVPLGYLLTGWIASLFGVITALLGGAILGLISTGVGWIWWKAAEQGMNSNKEEVEAARL